MWASRGGYVTIKRHIASIASFASLVVSLQSFEAGAACPVPNAISNGQVADASKVMGNFNALAACANAPAGAQNSVQYNAGSGNVGAIAPLSNGQLIIGSTGSAPQVGVITAGPGISVTNGPGTVTIGATGSGGGSGGSSIERELGPFLPPSASTFTFIDSPGGVMPTVSSVANVGTVYSVPVTSDASVIPGAYRAVPTSTSWTLTIRAKYSLLVGQWPSFGIWIKDTAGTMVGMVVEGNYGSSYLMEKRWQSNASFTGNGYVSQVGDPPSWMRVSYDGTNIKYAVSWDGQSWFAFFSEAKTAFLNGSLQYIGVGGSAALVDTTMWLPGSKTGATITYWDMSEN